MTSLGKSHKYGIKLFKLCRTDWYTYNVQIYTGKTQTEGKGLGCRVFIYIYLFVYIVVLDLCDRYLNIGRIFITDNFYTSIVLANGHLA